MPALKFPLASRATIALAVFAFVAVVAELDTLPFVDIVAKYVSVIAVAFHVPLVTVPTVVAAAVLTAAVVTISVLTFASVFGNMFPSVVST